MSHRPERRLPLVLPLAAAALAAAAGCSAPAPSGVPEEVVRHNILGTAYLGQQKWTEAGAEFDRALDLRPEDPLLLTNRAIALNQEGEIEKAQELLRRALAADPDHLYAHYNLGLIDSRQGDFDSAAEHFLAVARQAPADLLTQYFLGSSLARIGREDEAIAAYRAALALDPDHVSSLYGLGRVLLQRGDQEEGTRLIQRSQEVRARSGLDEAVGSQYGEQGPFALGIDYPGDALAAPDPIAVAFRPLARAACAAGAAAGAPASSVTPGPTPGSGELLVAEAGALRSPRAAGWTTVAELDVRAVRPGDLDGDGTLELLALIADGDGPVLRIVRPGAAAAAEADGFGRAELGALGLDPRAHADLALVDRDHDGDLDAVLCWTAPAGGTRAGCAIATNDGTGGFTVRASREHGFELDGSAGGGEIQVAFSDLDNDRDIDLLVAGPGGLRWFSNHRDGTFADESERVGLGAAVPAGSVAVADLDKDGRMDLVVTTPRAEILFNRPAGFERGPTFEIPAGVTPRVVVLDYDNDGFLDLARSGAEGVVIARNAGRGDWTDLPQSVGSGAAVPLAALDVDADGDLDLATWEPRADAAGVVLYDNDGGNARHWIRLDARGVGDNRRGVGARVEILAGALRQKFELTGPLPLHAGLGSRDTVEAVRYLWPSGVLQDEIELPAGGTVEIVQLDRKGTSCPLLYAWRDGGWRFVTDFLGGSAVGYRIAPGVLGTPDSDEYVKIEGGLTPDERGRLRLRLNNQLEEVIWFDAVELVVVDHPRGTQVYPDERLLPGPPFAPFGLFASADVRPITAARELETGRDVSERLRLADRRYADGFALRGPKGYAEPHTLELDLGPLPAGRRVVLLLDGWIDYADSTSNLAARQAALSLVPPRLRIADGRGGWREADERMGFPAGLPKTMTVDLGRRVAPSDPRVRIETTMRIFWDRVRVMVGGEETALRVERIAPLAAELRFGGFPRPTSPDGAPPFAYDPAVVSPYGGWKAHAGAYTAFGDVRRLLRGPDDRLVTTRNGDEIELAFPAPAPPAAGVERTYLLYADGFGKDMDPNSAASDEVGPVPFHGMPDYPYPADVAPATRPAAARRLVLPSPDGIPGARPLALVAATRARDE